MLPVLEVIELPPVGCVLLLAFRIVLKYAHMWLTFSEVLDAMTAIYVMKQLAHYRNVY